jgi:hypothetical protein
MIEKLGNLISLCRQAAPSSNELLLLLPRGYSKAVKKRRQFK